MSFNGAAMYDDLGSPSWSWRFVWAVAVLLLCLAPTWTEASLNTAPSYFLSSNVVRNVRRDFDGHVSLYAPEHRRDRTTKRQNAEVSAHLIETQLHRLRRRRTALQSNATAVSSSANKNDTSQEIGYLGYAYYAPLNLSSTDPQMVFVQLDTGSADLWVVSSACRSQQCQTERVYKFDEGKSSSFSFLHVGENVNVTSSSSDGDSSNRANVTVTAQSAAQATGGVPSGSSKRHVERRADVEEPTNLSDTIAFNVVYTDGTGATGALAEEFITLADISASEQVFGWVNDTNVTLSQQGISGVLGMGFPRGSAIARSLIGATTNVHTTPLLTTLLTRSNSSYPLFTLLLDPADPRLTVGAADSHVLPTAKERGQVEWHDVVPFPSGNTGRASNATVNQDANALGSYLYWVIEMTAAGVNGSSVLLTPTYTEVGRQPLALLDSGSPGIVGPWSSVSEMFGQINGARHVGAGRYVVPCTTQERMFFSFGGRNYTLLPEDYIIGPASGNPYLCLAWPAAAQASADGVDWVLGLPFLQAQYTLFSLGIAARESPKIGLYPLRAAANATDERVVFAPEDAASLSAYVSQATPIATTLPNSLVTTPARTSTSAYVFINATYTPSLGLLPSIADADAVAPSTYQPLLTAQTGNVNLPVLSSTVEQIPVPSNPAEDHSSAAPSSLHINLLTFSLWTLSLLAVLLALTGL